MSQIRKKLSAPAGGGGEPEKRSHPGNPGTDYVFLGSVLALLGTGLIMVLSASGVMAERVWGDTTFFFKKQLVFTLLGLGVMAWAWRMPTGLFTRTVYLWLLAAFALLVLTFSPLGLSAGGARRWLDLGPVSFQPLELAKVSLVLYLGYFFSRKQDKLKTFSVGFLPPVIVTAAMALCLLLQPDFGGAVFLTALFFLLCVVGGARPIYLILSLGLSATAAAWMIIQSPYRIQRWLAFLHPFQDAKNTGYQVVQSLYGLGAGQLFGRGLGAGKQKLFFLPEAHTDFILAVLGEELGFVGISFVFLCVGVIMIKSFAIAYRQQDLQLRFTALGLALVMVMGALMNMAVVMGAVPPKGLPMPFISYGGSNLLVMCLCVGLLLNISKKGRA